MSRFGNLEFGEESQRENSEAAFVPKGESYYLSQAETAFHRGHFEAGLRGFAKVIEYNPRNAIGWGGQVRMLIELGEFREARLWAEKALETFPNDPELLAAKAVALARTGDLQGALAFSDCSIEERGNTPYIWLARADVLLARKERRADYCFEKALAFEPENWFFHWLAARIHCFYEQFARGLKSTQQALALDAAQAVLWLQMGRCQMALGLAAQSRISLEHAQELDPDSASAELEMSRARNCGIWDSIRRRCMQWFSR